MQTQPTQIKISGITSTAELFCLRPWEVEEAWPQIETLLERIEELDWNPEDVQSMLENRQAILWGIKEAGKITGMWITRVEDDGKKRWGLVWLAAGEGLERGLSLYEQYTEPYFKQERCKFILLVGRKGWQKVLHGYRENGVRLIKRL